MSAAENAQITLIGNGEKVGDIPNLNEWKMKNYVFIIEMEIPKIIDVETLYACVENVISKQKDKIDDLHKSCFYDGSNTP